MPAVQRLKIDSISIIIPALNSLVIDRVVGAVLQQVDHRPVEVLIVGRDEAKLIPQSPLVRFIDTGSPIGPGAARNRGVAQSRGELLCFLDADCVPQPGWLDRIVQAHEAGHQVVSGGVALSRHGYWALCDDLLVFGSLLPTTPAGPRHRLPSLNLSIDRSIIMAHAGFDERFFPAGEDSDLSYRLRKAGYTLFCEPRAIVVHAHNRRTIGDALRHLFTFGAAQVPLSAQHPQIATLPAHRLAARFPLLLLLAAPLLATVDIVLGFVRSRFPQRFWYAVPGLVVIKSGWYAGLAMALRASTRARHQTATV